MPRTLADTSNLTGRSRPGGRLLRPRTTAQVQRIVRLANLRGWTVNPVSTGLNYGYGGASPARTTDIQLDLRRMTAIRNAAAISRANPVAVIEPGVTQQALYAWLQQHHPDLAFNVTGSARETSIIGNALDRGVGYFGPRREDLFGLEIVTGTGELLRTGFRRLGEESPLAHSHPYGLGPILDGLFFQGNFGIVTSACFRLVPRRPVAVAITLGLRAGASLASFIDRLAELKREAVMDSVTHIGNRARSHASLMYGITTYLEQQCGRTPAAAASEAREALAIVAQGEWTGLGAVTGTKAQVKANLAELRARLGDLATVRVLTEERLALGYRVMHALRFLRKARANAAAIAALRPLHVLALGQPTDAAIDNLSWRYGQPGLPATRLDATRCGLLFINPALPMDGALVAALVRELEDLARPFELYMTINIETATSLVAVINLLFDRSKPAETAAAQRKADALHAHLRSHGLEVYRARADMMAAIVDPADPYWQAVAAIKRALDPNAVIAPGRYGV
ncbi:4-cresol dehydrogenase (hydroxylating) [Pseudoduganella lurida]|uniref:4-cresol dehydrogenase (Hydroxylating) n=1 Tax=Pseudoduganella lurida TaxID=1036180 RepID=A0A562R3Q0_9BURK|nr:FAD-binding oxidoreductase [Pseudoduganella lurida]TWI62996.1 4-cresol dehydrogenase (hydroxylating) [Pseudoduganella lurida]